MAETNCPYCKGPLPDNALMCPECGFRLGPEPERKEKLELTDEQAAALAGFSAAQLELEERKRGLAAKGTKTGAGLAANWPKIAIFVIGTFVLPPILIFALQKMGVLGNQADLGKMLTGSVRQVGDDQRQASEINKELTEQASPR
jgi:hypothetical protein